MTTDQEILKFIVDLAGNMTVGWGVAVAFGVLCVLYRRLVRKVEADRDEWRGPAQKIKAHACHDLSCKQHTHEMRAKGLWVS